jgi:competence protein ComEA
MKITSEEKIILISIIVAAAAGILINIFFSYNNRLQVKDYASTPLLVNINTADAGELDKLPGIGKIIAERIVSVRDSQGTYVSVDDLKKVKGITPKKLDKLRKYVTVEPAK